MTRPYIPFLAFLILILLTIPFSFDNATSVGPGWHTTIFSPYFICGLIVIITLLLLIIAYWLIAKRTDRVNWTLYVIHFALTIATVIYLKFPSIFLNTQMMTQDVLIKAMEFRMKLIPVAWTVFIVGQIFFLIYYIGTIKAKPIAT